MLTQSFSNTYNSWTYSSSLQRQLMADLNDYIRKLCTRGTRESDKNNNDWRDKVIHSFRANCKWIMNGCLTVSVEYLSLLMLSSLLSFRVVIILRKCVRVCLCLSILCEFYSLPMHVVCRFVHTKLYGVHIVCPALSGYCVQLVTVAQVITASPLAFALNISLQFSPFRRKKKFERYLKWNHWIKHAYMDVTSS